MAAERNTGGARVENRQICHMQDPYQRLHGLKAWLWLAAAALMLAAIAIAHWPLLAGGGRSDAHQVSVGHHLLLFSAIPWLLQWGSLALCLALLAEPYLDRPVVLTAIGCPLTLGFGWWAGVVTIHWHHDLIQFVTASYMRLMAFELASESFAEGVFFDVLGPLTAPLMLRGPWTLARWTFAWTTLSTALTMIVIVAAEGTLSHLRQRDGGRLRCWLAGSAFVILFNLPILLRVGIRLARALPSS